MAHKDRLRGPRSFKSILCSISLKGVLRYLVLPPTVAVTWPTLHTGERAHESRGAELEVNLDNYSFAPNTYIY